MSGCLQSTCAGVAARQNAKGRVLMFNARRLSLTVCLAASVALVGCGGEGSGTSASSAEAEVSVVRLTGNDMMKYNLTTVAVDGDKPVRLTLRHIGEMPLATMGHNFVLLRQGVDVAEFAAAAITATETGYIPADRAEDVIVHTRMLGGGESDTIEFDPPAPGTYKFICTFPGHYAMMQGDFIVR